MPLLLVLLAADPTFPDPLLTRDGTRVASAADWHARRAPELRQLFQTHMYGADPAVTPDPRAKVLFENHCAFGSRRYALQEWALTLADGAPPVHVLIARPAQVKPKGLFVGLSFSGNHTLTDDPGVRVSEAFALKNYADAPRGKFADTWPLKAIVERGYAVAVAHYGEVIPDDPKLSGGLSAILRPRGSDTGAVMAWGWGLRQIGAWAGTLPELKHVPRVAVGHSRLGKAAITAVAFDTAGVFAAAIPAQAGTGGTSPNRKTNPKAEPVKRISTAFPHWFAPAYTGYGDDPAKLPFDQHELLALCAPRPMFLPNAEDDPWADPPGQWEMAKRATPVYKLLGVDGVNEADPAAGRLGYWVRPGKHAMTPDDWAAYLTWADKWVK